MQLSFSILENWQFYLEILALMLSTFLIGYFASLHLNRTKLKSKIKKLQKENRKLRSEKSKDIDVIFTEIEPKIIEVIENREREKTIAKKQPEQKVASKARELYIKSKDELELNFDHFGYASAWEKDDLTKITGVGPFIEEKLNGIGIYTYDQISRFSEEDMFIVTDSIDFFPGRMMRDNWVGQAEALKEY